MDEITVIRAGALGDVFLILPALAALRAIYPHARLRVAGYPAVWEVAAPLVDETLSIDAPAFADLFANLPSERLRGRLGSSDLVVAWMRHDPSAVLRATGVRHVLHAPPYGPPGRHVAEWTLETLAPVVRTAAPVDPWSWRLPLQPNELAEGRRTLDRLGLRAPVLFGAGAGAAWKRWPAERYAALAADLCRRGREVALVEGPADREAVAAVQRSLGTPLPVLLPAGARSLAAVLAHASLVVGNDSGVTHLAAVAGAPVVALFGPTDPALWRPLGDALVLRRCDRRATEEAPIRVCDDPACVQAITVEEVLRAAGTLDVENCVERGRNAR